MAHAHKRTLVQSLIADKNRGGDHDLICVYLSDRSEELLERFFPTPPNEIIEKATYQDSMGKEHYQCDWRDREHLEYVVEGTCDYITANLVAATEVMLTKGEGKYQTTVGFMDVVVKRSIKRITRASVIPSGPRLQFHRDEVQYDRGCKRVNYEYNYSGRPCTKEAMEWKLWHEPEPSLVEGRIVLPQGPISIPEVLVIRPDGSEKLVDHINCSNHVAAHNIAIEVKDTPTPVSDVVKQFGLYRKYYIADVWLLVTSYPLSASDKKVLEMADIKHMRIGDKFQQWKIKNTEQVESEEF